MSNQPVTLQLIFVQLISGDLSPSNYAIGLVMILNMKIPWCIYSTAQSKLTRLTVIHFMRQQNYETKSHATFSITN